MEPTGGRFLETLTRSPRASNWAMLLDVAAAR
jgi:hypothetical protein